jgi:ABC-2 type transport system ATP-binding protein
VAIIHKGRLVANGSLEELREGVETTLAGAGMPELGKKLTLEEIFLNVVGADTGEPAQELSWLS